MFKRMVLGLLFVLAPSAAWAQGLPESYLPAKSQLYFRADGMLKHQAAYDKTAAGQMMKGETGKFVRELWKYVQEIVVLNVAEKDPRVEPLLKDLGKLLYTVYDHGLVVGLEVDAVIPPLAQVVLVFPKGAGESGALLPLIQKIGEGAMADVKNTKVGNRFVNHVEIKMVKLGWWAQGDDAVIFFGTTDPVAYAKSIDAKKTGLAKNPLYLKTAGYKEFTTATRGYFDMAGVLNVAAEVDQRVDPIVEQLGFKGLKSVTFASGYDGPYQRSIVDLDMPNPRKGLLRFSSQKKFGMKDLPVLPNDINGFSAYSLNLSKSYDVIVNLLDGIVRVFDANKADDLQEQIKALQGALGVDLDKELFSQFGDLVVTYRSPSDGLFSSLTAVQVKDGKKLDKAIEKIIKAIPANPAGQFSLKRKSYLGGEILQLLLSGDQGDNVAATFGIYKNWLLTASTSQPIKGFIMRQEGKLPAWKAEESLTKVLNQFPKEFTAITVDDPRPTVQSLLAAAPPLFELTNTLGALAAQFGPMKGIEFKFRPFDIDLIPHAQEATLQLFPNVTITIDDGKRVRTETRGSL